MGSALHLNTIESTLKATHSAMAETLFLLNRTETLVRRWRKRRGRRRQRASFRDEGGSAAQYSRLLVLGIISNPRTPHIRDWIRRTYLSTVPSSDTALVRFVMGRRGLKTMEQSLQAEHAAHRDLEFIDASDFGERGGIFSCIDKLFAWFPHAVHAFPGARFYAKADDDSYVDVGGLLALLRPLAPLRNAYVGYVQYDSFLPRAWKHCGWAHNPTGAAHAHVHGCPRDQKKSMGPFPFVVGAMTAMGADLAGWMRSSASLHALVAAGRASQASPKAHWDCGYSDVTLGYALGHNSTDRPPVSLVSLPLPRTQTQTLPQTQTQIRTRTRALTLALTRTHRPQVSLVSVRDAMRDATYGAMNAKRFVISHHLRTLAQFEQAHKEASAQPAWRMREPLSCAPWAQVEQVGLPWTEEAAGERRSQPTTAELQQAMRTFGCCQQWQFCEVGPDGP